MRGAIQQSINFKNNATEIKLKTCRDYRVVHMVKDKLLMTWQ